MNFQTPCTYWAELLAISHPEEDLSPSEYAGLEKHVAECSSCAAVRERYKLMATRVRALPDVKPLSSFSLEFLPPQKEQPKDAAHSDVVVNSEYIRMSCNQVEELLNAYLDNSLALQERRGVVAHLQSCIKCSAMLAEFSANNALFSHFLPASHDPALRDRIFSSPEFLELTGTFDISEEEQQKWKVLKPPTRSAHLVTSGWPLLIGTPRSRNTMPKRTIPHTISSAAGRVFNSVATLLVIGIIIGGFCSFYFLKHPIQGVTSTGAPSTLQSTVTPAPSPSTTLTPGVSSYPNFVASYTGTVLDLNNSQQTDMFLTRIHQNGGSISGYFKGLGFVGPFTGTVTSSGHLQFTVHRGTSTLAFDGDILIGMDITGTFKVLDQRGQFTGESGPWNLSPNR